MNNKLLTIVVPTLNRRLLLEETLNLLLNDIQGLEAEVELIVIDNSSSDDTAEYIGKMLTGTAANFISFPDRLNIDDSFLRCVNTSTGKFINIFGDDDLPFPGYIKYLLNIIKLKLNIGLIYLNRLIGDENLTNIGEVAHGDSGLSVQVLDPDDFISKFTHWPSFVTALVFSKDCWVDGEWCYSNEFLGYKFLARVYAGLGKRKCVYVGIPQLVQRRGVQSWKSEWPRYWLVNFPKLLKTLEDKKISHNALVHWRTKEVSFKRMFIDCLVAKAFGYRIVDPFWIKASQYQNFHRSIAIHLIQIFVPSLLMRWLYFSLGKYKKK